MTITDDGEAFGIALRRQLGDRGQREFGADVAWAEGRDEPYSQQQVSFWLSGHEPNHRQAIAIEKALRLRPGTLTRLLGFLPLDARSSSSVEDAVKADPNLDKRGREAVLGVYRTMAQGPRS